MQKVCVNLALLLSLLFETGCFARKLGFQPPSPPELASAAKSRPPQQTGSLLAGDWQTKYQTSINNGLCADGTKPTGSTCTGGTAYSDYLKGVRNSYIEAIRGKVDENYSNFKGSVYSGNALFGLSTDWAIIGLGGAGTVVTDTALKSILAVASSGVAGASASYQKQILNQQNALAVVSGMDAARAAQYTIIAQSEAQDLTKYSLQNGLSDLQKYYDAGTMLGGILYIQGQMQSQAQGSQQLSQSLKTGKTGLNITPPTLSPATVGAVYPSVALIPSGGTSPYKWTVSVGSLPAGLSLNPNTGVISGTPTAHGTVDFTVQVADSSTPAQTATANLSIIVN